VSCPKVGGIYWLHFPFWNFDQWKIQEQKGYLDTTNKKEAFKDFVDNYVKSHGATCNENYVYINLCYILPFMWEKERERERETWAARQQAKVVIKWLRSSGVWRLKRVEENFREKKVLGIKSTPRTRGSWPWVTSVLLLKHSSWLCIERLSLYDNTSDLPNSATVRNIPRSPWMIGANIPWIFTPRRNIPRSPCMIRVNISQIFTPWRNIPRSPCMIGENMSRRIGRSTLQPSRRYLLKLE